MLDTNHSNDVIGVGSANFALHPNITVSEPLLDSNIVVGSSNTNAVKWSINGSAKVTQVDIFYDEYGGLGVDGTPDTADEFLKQIAVDQIAGNGQVDWNNVLDDISGDVVIKVFDSSTPPLLTVFGL